MKIKKLKKAIIALLPAATTFAIMIYVKTGAGNIDWNTVARGTPGKN